MDFQSSRTFQNLQTAYKEELMASTRYNIFSDIAKNEGFIEIGNIYDVTARNEKEHARVWLRRINQGTLPKTAEVLQESSQYEYMISSTMYQEFASIALEEGYNDIAALFNGIANIDYNHSDNFNILYENVLNNEVFCKPESTLWICLQCGNILFGDCAPAICPICGFPQGYYKLYDETITT